MKNEKIHVLYVGAECSPFAATGGLGDVLGSLPKGINSLKNAEARVVMPLYEGIFPALVGLKHIADFTVPVSWRNQSCSLFSLEQDGVLYYFLRNDYYFKRAGIYGQFDDGERFAFLSRAALEIIPRIGWRVDVLHAHDWQTALVPVYYKLFYNTNPSFSGIKTVFTIHNIEYQGKFDRSILEDVFGISGYDYPSLEFDGAINLMKAAIEYCDALTTVSPTYAKQLTSSYYAHGLEEIIKANSHKLTGILNGIDVDYYNPSTNPSVFSNFSADDVSGKLQNKLELQKLLNLPVSPDIPMLAVISRLAAHKGLELIKYALTEIIKEDVQIVIIGKGDQYYEQYFSYMQQVSESKISTIIAFNKDLAQKLYAASDIFLMPSRSEPCGLSQMIACRYGSVPVVRATGGLKDTIIDVSKKGGNGFVFEGYSSNDFTAAVLRAVKAYHEGDWEEIRKNAMRKDFSWKKSAKAYIKLYEKVLAN